MLKSEQKYEEMVDVLYHLQQYVPRVASTDEVAVPGLEEPVTIPRHEFYKVGLGKFVENITTLTAITLIQLTIHRRRSDDSCQSQRK